MKKCFFCLLLTLSLLPAAIAESQLRIADRKVIPVRRELLGVNQLAYGDNTGYGMVIAGTHTVEPELVKLLRESGFRSQRYPGGCGGTHNYNWKVSAGLEDPARKPALGLMEFLSLCEETGMMPVLGISAFRGSPAEAAEFVEFLNAPDDGRHPWAKRRAELGHPEPYGAVYFEYGNESYHGNHYKTPLLAVTGEKYAENYLAFREAMRAVDPRIRLGVVMDWPSVVGEQYWNGPIFKVLGNNFDFLIAHYYIPFLGYDKDNYFRNFHQQQRVFRRTHGDYRRHAEEVGATDLKIANTEFNTDVPVHQTLYSALLNAEWLRMFCYESEIFVAHYWQFVNEAWGMVRHRDSNFVKRPNYLMMQLFGRYLLDELLTPEITGSTFGRRFPEAARLSKAERNRNLLPEQPWQLTPGDHYRLAQLPDGTLEVEFTDATAMNFFHAYHSFPADPRYGYRLTGEIRVEGMAGSTGAALEIGDSRGWEKTRSAESCKAVFAPEWTPVSVDFVPLADTSNLTVKARRMAGGGVGKMFFRNLKVTRFAPEAQILNVAGATVSRSADGKRFAVIAINRSLAPEELTIRIPGIRPVAAEVLTGPSPQADNETSPAVKVIPLEATRVPGGVKVLLPPHSLAGIALAAGD